MANPPLLDGMHVYHHDDPRTATVKMAVERNSKGYNWSVEVSGAGTVHEAFSMIVDAETQLAQRFSTTVGPSTAIGPSVPEK